MKSLLKIRVNTKGRYFRLFCGSLIIIILGTALGTFLDRWHSSRATKLLAQSPDTATPAFNLTEIMPPTELSLFGERIPLEVWEVRERFEREFYYNLGNPDQILLYWKRAQRYFPKIEKMLADSGIPPDFKFLMIAESGARNVKSPANANGFWQFIPGTGMIYGLRVDDVIDERLDPELSTLAAIRYFHKMKSELTSWTLVAAGFNMSEDNVRIVLGWQHQTNYWNLFVNEETMRYLLRIAAIKELLEHGDKYGLDFKRAVPFRDPTYRTVNVDGPIASISDWAQQQGYAYKDVKIFNPWLIGRSLPEGHFTLKLPATDLDRTTTSDQ